MNKSQIKAGLRRSASLVESTGDGVSFSTWEFLIEEGFRRRFIDYFEGREHESTFYLFVAEAL